jgi:hypothetical protein
MIALLVMGAGSVALGADIEHVLHETSVTDVTKDQTAAELKFTAALRALRADDKRLLSKEGPRAAQFHNGGLARDAEGQVIPGVIYFSTDPEVNEALRDEGRLTRATGKLMAATTRQAGTAGVPALAIYANLETSEQYTAAEKADAYAISHHHVIARPLAGGLVQPIGFPGS